MFVANCMTKNPVTISPDAGIDEASKLMDKGHFRRLPVVEHGKLVGFFTNRDLLRASPSSATTLDRFEVRTLLSKIKVADVMQKNVITVTDTTTIEEAALIMAREKIGGMPVLSEIGKVVGIISSTDIFRAFVTIMGLVASGVGIAFLLDMVVRDVPGIRAIPLATPTHVDVGLAWKRDRYISRAAQSFIDFSKDILSRSAEHSIL